ncbi:hypothetical protein BAZOLSSOX_1366 [uncultured Gammaproteobacteria bacterium]|nr:hypothetical protein BAZOLSSOX_1366 [uncultured Gammaproteobacteria bacterium]
MVENALFYGFYKLYWVNAGASKRFIYTVCVALPEQNPKV